MCPSAVITEMGSSRGAIHSKRSLYVQKWCELPESAYQWCLGDRWVLPPITFAIMLNAGFDGLESVDFSDEVRDVIPNISRWDAPFCDNEGILLSTFLLISWTQSTMQYQVSILQERSSWIPPTNG